MIGLRLIAASVVVAALAASIAGAYWLGHRAGTASVERDWEREKALAASATANLQARYREQEKEMLREREIVEQNYLALVERSRRDAAAAGSELEQLRRTVAARSSSRRVAETATCPTSVDDSAAERELLVTCAAEYQTMAREADEIADRLRGLQAHKRAVQAGGGVGADAEN